MTAEEIRERLERKLLAQRPEMITNERFFTGTQPLAFMDPELLRMLDGRLGPINVNLCRMSVEAVTQSLEVVAFRSSPGQVVDEQLMSLWQANDLDEQSQAAHTDALVYGRGFVLVWTDEAGRVTITAESPLQVTVERDPVTRRVTAALKRWADLDGTVHALLITPGEIVEYAGPGTYPLDPNVNAVTAYNYAPTSLEIVRSEPNALGVVPIVPIVNRYRLMEPDGTSDLVDIRAIVQAIGKLASDLMTAAEFAAAPRRWVTGLVPDNAYAMSMTAEQREQLENNIRDKWERARASKFIAASSESARFGSFEQAELTNFETAVRLLTGQVAALAALPPYWLNDAVANPTSADAIRAGEARLTARIRQRQRWFSGAWESVMRLAVLVRDGVADPRLDDLVTVWRDPEPATIAQEADAAAKLVGAGITDRRAALEALGYSPLDIDRMLTSDTAMGAQSQRDLNLAETIQKVYLGVGKVITSDEAREIVNGAGADLSVPGPNFATN